ncbi:hypothetical protein [Asticcacaulis sp. EMRT-3]|nr:hypothetical protein [Asticcacaulis sp. EMRT-3]MDI7775203.1 hypothetical protein [Asticcacaulis sp. EMRT-3]
MLKQALCQGGVLSFVFNLLGLPEPVLQVLFYKVRLYRRHHIGFI